MDQIVEVIVVLVGLFFTVATPIMRNTKAMTELNVNLVNLTRQHEKDERNNTEAHRRLWAHNEEQDKMLARHDTEIELLKKEGK